MNKVVSRFTPVLRARVMKFAGRDDYFHPELLAKAPVVMLELAVAERFFNREKEYARRVRSVGLDQFDLLVKSKEELARALSLVQPDRQTLICADRLSAELERQAEEFCDAARLERVQVARPEAQWASDQVTLQYAMVEADKQFETLAELLRVETGGICLVVTDSDRVSRYVVDRLLSVQIPAELLAYAMQLDVKNRAVKTVVEAGRGVLVGCEAAMNGLQLPKIDHLISWELPSQLDHYWRRIDRFSDQTAFRATVLVERQRIGGIRALERRLGKRMTQVGPTPEPPDRSRRTERPADHAERRPAPRPAASAGEQAAPTRAVAEPDRTAPTPAPQEVSQAAPAAVERPIEPYTPGGIQVGERFREAVFAKPEELKRLAPEGFTKDLGSKFVPARKRR